MRDSAALADRKETWAKNRARDLNEANRQADKVAGARMALQIDLELFEGEKESLATTQSWLEQGGPLPLPSAFKSSSASQRSELPRHDSKLDRLGARCPADVCSSIWQAGRLLLHT